MWPVELSSEMKFTFTFQGPADSFYNKRPTQGEGFPSVPEMWGNRERRKKFNGTTGVWGGSFSGKAAWCAHQP